MYKNWINYKYNIKINLVGIVISIKNLTYYC